jgi:hypothetical protein
MGGGRSDFCKEPKKCQSPRGYVADHLRGNHAFAREDSFGRSSIRFLAGAELCMPMTAILKVSICVDYYVTMIVQGIWCLSVCEKQKDVRVTVATNNNNAMPTTDKQRVLASSTGRTGTIGAKRAICT